MTAAAMSTPSDSAVSPRGRTPKRYEEAYVKALEEEKDEAMRRAAEAEHKAIEEACRAKQLSQERTQLMLQLSETETTLEQRMASAERALQAVIAKMEAERDQLLRDLADCHHRLEAGNVSDARAERKQIVEDLRAIKSDAENSLEQRLEVAEKELVYRLQSIEARVAKAQETAAANKPLVVQEDISKEFIEGLSREKSELSAKLQDAWIKIEELEKMLQDERATFWEELDLMRMDKGNRQHSSAQNIPAHAVVLAPASQPSARVLSSPTSVTTPTVVRFSGKGLMDSTPGATPSPRQPGYQIPTIKATPGVMPSCQRLGLYP